MNSVICGCVLLALLTVSYSEALSDANRRLQLCCDRQKDAEKECKQEFCDFGALNSDNLNNLLSKCNKGTTLMRLWDCASSRVDHTECCRKKNVQKHCLPYCNTRKIIPSDQKYLACLPSFNAIRQCFQEHLENNPNIYGDN
uniref:DB domain-containing protein n=1 Tax=Syphacia muris TaxID=451379 RepID=A0A0N5AHB3_9BILA